MLKVENHIFQVSVIIPVYNAEKFLRKSVESAETLQEVAEIILVEDKSPDNALQLCKELEREYSKVKLFQHPNGENRGAGASRNLGIEKAQCKYIAFLDADDWYLPNRFLKDEELFKIKNIDGVYNATGYFYENETAENTELTQMADDVLADQLLLNLLQMKGRFHTNSITVRKELLIKSGVFDESLKLHQDTHLWYRLAYWGNLISGIRDEPVAMRRVHENNRIANKNLITRSKLHNAVFDTFKNYKDVNKEAMQIIINRYTHSISKNMLERMIAYMQVFKADPNLIKCYL